MKSQEKKRHIKIAILARKKKAIMKVNFMVDDEKSIVDPQQH